MPANAVLVVAGDCDPGEVTDLAGRHFAHIDVRPAPPRGAFGEPCPTKQRRKVIKDALIPQPAFAAGYRVPDPVAELKDYVAYFVLASVLSEGDASRLRSRLIDRDRTVTDLGCMLGVFGNDTFTMRDPVLFQVVVFHPGVASVDALLAVVDQELERLAADGPAEDELVRTSASAALSHWLGLDPVLNRALALAGTEVVHNRAELVSELPGLVASVRPEEVAAAAADCSASTGRSSSCNRGAALDRGCGATRRTRPVGPPVGRQDLALRPTLAR